jgi:hypothetical protein
MKKSQVETAVPKLWTMFYRQDIYAPPPEKHTKLSLDPSPRMAAKFRQLLTTVSILMTWGEENTKEHLWSHT